MSIGENGTFVIERLSALSRHNIRRIARWAAQVRNTRAWPLVKPAYNFMKRFIDIEGILGPSSLHVSDDKKENRAIELEAKLWGGFSRYALTDLEKLRRSRFASLAEQSFAAWALARWYALEEDYDRALDYAVFMRSVRSRESKRKGQVLLEADCLMHLGYPEKARRILDSELERRGYDWIKEEAYEHAASS